MLWSDKPVFGSGPCEPLGARVFYGLVLAVALFVSMPGAYAATLTVTNANDSGIGSLRNAINDAGNGDDIVFDPSLVGSTITLTSADIVIDKNVSVVGLGVDDLVISGGGINRVFQVGVGVTVTISDMTIRDGVARRGGGIFNAGTLTVQDCRLTGNTAQDVGSGSVNGGAIINAADSAGGASLTMERCTLENNTSDGEGGALGNVSYEDDAVAALTVQESTIVNNQAAYGGGVANYAQYGGAVDARFVNSTITGNTATNDGGGLDVDLLANGVMARLTLINTTVHNNTANGGGGGVATTTGGATVVLRNSVVAGNVAGAASNEIRQGNVDVDIVFSGGNVIGSDAGLQLYSQGPKDRVGSASSPIDPVLGALADNGGPTETHLPDHNSPAVDAAVGATCEGLDQRGESRPADGNIDGSVVCDSGAVEVQASDLTIDSVSANTVGNGSAQPSSQNVVRDETASVEAQPDAGFAVAETVGGDCPVGSWSSTTYTTGAIGGDCAVELRFGRAAITGSTASGDPVQASLGGGSGAGPYPWVFDDTATNGVIPVSGGSNSPQVAPPDSLAFPYELLDFGLHWGTAGADAILTIGYPDTLPADAEYWVYSSQDDAWSALAADHYTIAGSVVTLEMADGGVGDDDGSTNNLIAGVGGLAVPTDDADPGDPGDPDGDEPGDPTNPTTTIKSVPAVSSTGLLALAGMFAGLAAWGQCRAVKGHGQA